jgi:Protein of unknown function (DUF2971)
MLVYYLTAAPFALSNLALRRVKVSRISDLNDPFEMLAVDLEGEAHRAAFLKLKQTLNKDKGMICLSETWSNPVLWGHYAEKHTGVALGFDVRDDLLLKVIYANAPKKIPIDPTTNELAISENFVNELLRTKFYDWQYEKEVRVFVSLDHETQESGCYFYDFSSDFQLKEIVLGAKCELPIERVRAVVASYEPAVSVIKARIAFNSFTVVRDGTSSETE